MRTQHLDDWPLIGRSWERNLLSPLVGESMLELGNKVNTCGDVRLIYKAFFISKGFRHVSVDMNGKDGAIKKDLRKPLGLGTFDMVTNLGTTEHVSPGKYEGQAACWQNICEAMHVGSVLVSVTPKPGAQKWATHGCWYPEPGFFTDLAGLNGMVVERLYTDDNLVFARLRRESDQVFLMPDDGMFHNRNWRQSSDNIA